MRMGIPLKKNEGMGKKFYGILLSYLLVLVIPIICGAFLHIYNKKLVTEQSETMTQRMLTNIREQTDAYMENIWQMALVASQLESINRVLGVNSQNRADQAYELYQVGQDLQMFYSFDKTIKDVFVYFKEADRIVGMGSVMDPDIYSEMFLDPGITGAYLREQLKEPRFKDCVKVKNRTGGEDILCVMSNPQEARSGSSQYVVFVVIERESLSRLLKSIQWMDGTIVMIQDREGQLLYETENANGMDYISKIADMEDTENSYHGIQLQGRKYAAMVEESEKTKWKYYAMIPRDSIEENANRMQMYYFLMLFGCIAVGFAAAGIMSRKHYHPVKVLSDLILQFKSQNETKEEKQPKDNYIWLQEQVDLFFKERVNTIRILKRNKRELKNYYLLRLLENSYTADLDENLKKCQILFDHPWYAVIQFVIEDKEADAQALAQFVLKNVFTELMEESGGFRIYMVHVGERIVGISNFEKKEDMKQIHENIYRMQEMVEDKFHYEVTALLGDCYPDRTEIFKSYGDTCEMEEYISLLDDTLICYEEVRERDQKYRYNAEFDQKLYNAVRAGNLSVAQEELRKELKQYFSKEVSLNVYRCLMFDILGTILRAADAEGCHDVTEEDGVMMRLSTRLPLKQMEKLFMDLIEKICTRVREIELDTGRDMELSRKVQKYIQENFRNPDINVSQTGQYFHITPSYLSAIYKKQTGTSLLEYINGIRLKEAEHLLERGVSVVEVAEKAGFRDSTYLIRVFKKKKGITPGQKKQNL